MTCLPKIAALLSLLSPRNGRPLKMQPLLCGGSVSKWLNLAVSHSRSPSPQEQCRGRTRRRHSTCLGAGACCLRKAHTHPRRLRHGGGPGVLPGTGHVYSRGRRWGRALGGGSPGAERLGGGIVLGPGKSDPRGARGVGRGSGAGFGRGWGAGGGRRGGGGRMVVALPSWLSGVTPCDLVAFLFGLSAILAPRAERSFGVRVQSSRVHIDPSFFCAGGGDPQFAPLSLCTKSWLLGDPSPAHAGSPHPGIDFRGIPQVIPADG